MELPLQAADFWAWWVRKRIDDGQEPLSRDFGSWKVVREEYPRFHINFDEDALVREIIKLMRPMLEPWRIIYDVRFSPERFP